MNRKKLIKAFVQMMNQKNIDAYIIPTSDFHQSEYVADYFKYREWISGFTGSYGTVVLTTSGEHGLWTDGRYFLQAEKELEGSGIKLFKMRQPNVPKIREWLLEKLPHGSTVGLDGKAFSANQMELYTKTFKEKDIQINSNNNLIDELWEDRPTLPQKKVFEHVQKYAGESVEDKLKHVREKMTDQAIDYFIISSLDDIAWLYNLRGSDVDFNPVFLAYTIIEHNKATIYMDQRKLSKTLMDKYTGFGIEFKPYDAIYEAVEWIKESTIYYSPKNLNYAILNKIDLSNHLKKGLNFTTEIKALKNKTERKNFKNVFVKDGIAMTKFIYWLKKNVSKEEISEYDAQCKLSHLRKEQPLYQQDSFNYISGYQENGAIIHYSAKENACSMLQPEGFYLIDSGGQYLDGTTDITRTLALGKLSDAQKRDYTLVLKGHINLDRAKFMKGTRGSNIDILARQPLWENGLNYNHGTGHGIGYFLNVHEGPQNISMNPTKISLKPGMVISNEPGIYRPGKYGIRLENIVIVTEDKKTDFGEFYKFETMTLCPFDREAIITDLLTIKEKLWLNNYHQAVFDAISPGLSTEEVEWLRKETQPIR